MNSSIGDEGPEYQPLSADNVFDAAWEARARKALDVSGWDSGLAIAAARDALAVVAGDLSEDEFQARHHDAYLREFGMDLRPGGEGLSTPAADAPAGPAPLDPRLPPSQAKTPPPGPPRPDEGTTRQFHAVPPWGWPGAASPPS